MSTDSIAPAEVDGETLTPLTEPRDGVPKVYTTSMELENTVLKLQAGSGAIAIDAERASGFRYGQRNYLIQLRRQGSGTFLIDPVALPDLSAISQAGDATEWVFHAAIQDLPSLHEQNIRPAQIFDTELGSRILGLERVGLAYVVAELLGFSLAKEHAAQDWSVRPIPQEWLKYAALDVELLIPLRDELAERLDDAGKLEWAKQEFEAVRTRDFGAKRQDPWRRISGLHTLRSRRELVIARELWLVRDRIAQNRDIAPSRILPDHAIIKAAALKPRSIGELSKLHSFGGSNTRRRAAAWQKAIDTAQALPSEELPELKGPKRDTPPPPRVWAQRSPEAAVRLEKSKQFYEQLSEQVNVPKENLLTPEILRKLCWSPPRQSSTSDIESQLLALGARPWQVELGAPHLASIFTEAR